MHKVQAEEALMLVRSDEYKRSFVYISWLARVLIMNGKPDAAWRLYINMDSKRTSDSFSLLHLLANECFGMGQFYHSCKAFQVCACVLDCCGECCVESMWF
jgi:intraflagellar transport protein 56